MEINLRELHSILKFQLELSPPPPPPKKKKKKKEKVEFGLLSATDLISQCWNWSTYFGSNGVQFETLPQHLSQKLNSHSSKFTKNWQVTDCNPILCQYSNNLFHLHPPPLHMKSHERNPDSGPRDCLQNGSFPMRAIFRIVMNVMNISFMPGGSIYYLK